MSDADADHRDQRLPAIVLCAYDAQDAVWDPVEDLAGNEWRPSGARTVSVSPSDPDSLFEALTRQLDDRRCRAFILVGRSRREGRFTVQMRTENRQADGSGRLDADLPSLARATLPAAEIVARLNAAGLPADATSEAEPDIGSYLLFRILAQLPDLADPPVIGLLRVPADATLERACKGVKAAASAVAAQLSPVGRLQHA